MSVYDVSFPIDACIHLYRVFPARESEWSAPVISFLAARYLSWLRTVTIRSDLESCTKDRRLQEEGKWDPPQGPRTKFCPNYSRMLGMFDGARFKGHLLA